jgi:hypothetical protein
MEKKVFDLRFEATRNAIYHAARRRFFELLSRFLSFLVVVSGTVAVGNLINWDVKWPAAGAAVIGAMQLVFDFNGRARLHENLQRRYFEIIAKIEKILTPTEQEVADLKSEMNLLYADEPPPMRALDAIAYNKACDSLGCPEGRRAINPWQWALQHFYSFPDTEFLSATR